MEMKHPTVGKISVPGLKTFIFLNAFLNKLFPVVIPQTTCQDIVQTFRF